MTAEAVEAEAAPPTPEPPVITVTAEPVDNDQSTADATKEKQEKEEEAPFPAGQVLLGAGSALTLGSVALASAVGPWGLLLAPGAVAVGGGVFLATRGRKRSKRGRSSERGVFGGARSGAGARPVGRVGGARLGGGGRRSSGGGRGRVSPTHGGSRPAAARSVGLGARPAPTSRTAPWARGGTPRPGAGGRAVVAPPLRLRPAAGAGGRVPGGGAGVRPGGGGASRRVGRGSGMGPAPRNRWGASQQPSAHPRGGLRRAVRAAGRRAADWADDRSGRRLSTGWRAAKDQPGFRAAHRAARDTLRSKKRRGPATEVAALLVAVASWLRSLWARRQDSGGVKEKDKKSKKAAAAAASAVSESGAVSPAGDADVEETPPPRETTPPSSGEEDSPEHTSTTHTTRGGRVSTFPLLEIAAEMQGAAAKYSPETMWQVIADAEQLPGVIDSVASSIRIYLERLVSEQYPVDTAVIDQLGEVYRSLKTAAAQAEEVGPMIRNIHQHDVDRREAPRGDETRWNV